MSMAAGTSWSMRVDRIFIRDLAVRCIIGIGEDERRERQDVLINVALEADLKQAGKSDRFSDTVDYRALKGDVTDNIPTPAGLLAGKPTFVYLWNSP